MNNEEAKEYAKRQLEAYIQQRYGYDTRHNFRCLCPNHPDSNPSMSFDRDNQRVHCFGCGVSMDMFDLIGMEYNLTKTADIFSKTYEVLGISVDSPTKARAKDTVLNIRQSEAAVAYLEKRGISIETAERFKIGYMPDFKTKDEDTNKYINFRALIIPTANGLTARNIDTITGKNRFRKQGKSAIFNANALLNNKRVFAVEGEFDAMSIEELGYSAAALGSTSNINKFIQTYKRIGTKAEICVSMDNDEAGQKASVEFVKLLQSNGIPFVVANIADKYKDANERLVADREGLKQALDEASALKCKTNQPAAQKANNSPLDVFSASELMQMDLKPPYYCVEGFLPQGLAVLAAPSKYGKSWFVLDLCLSIATGKPFLGMNTNQSDVFYYSLEDSKNRLQERLGRLTVNKTNNFFMSIKPTTLDNGLIEHLTAHITAHPNTKLIVIDTLQKIRSRPKMRENAYSNDYNELGQLKAFADKYAICVMVVHHTHKMKGAADCDVFERISGTTGIMGTADTIIMLSRERRNDENTTMSITGRDVEQSEYILKFDNCQWYMIGDSEAETEKQEIEAYKNNPIVRTVKKLVASYGSWRGTAKELNNNIKEITGKSINTNERSPMLSKELQRLKTLFLEIDNIEYTNPKYAQGGERLHIFKKT